MLYEFLHVISNHYEGQPRLILHHNKLDFSDYEIHDKNINFSIRFLVITNLKNRYILREYFSILREFIFEEVE